jgi:hypothetical protein
MDNQSVFGAKFLARGTSQKKTEKVRQSAGE